MPSPPAAKTSRMRTRAGGRVFVKRRHAHDQRLAAGRALAAQPVGDRLDRFAVVGAFEVEEDVVVQRVGGELLAAGLVYTGFGRALALRRRRRRHRRRRPAPARVAGFSFGTNTPNAGLPCIQRSMTAF